MKHSFPTYLTFLGLTFLLAGFTFFQDSPLGLFEKHGDVGSVGKPGAVEYDRGSEKLPNHRRRRKHVGDHRRLPLRLEASVGRCFARCRHSLAGGRWQRPSESRPHHSSESRCRFGLRRRRLARGRPDIAAIPRSPWRPHPRDSIERQPRRRESESKEREIMSPCRLPAKEKRCSRPAVRSRSN